MTRKPPAELIHMLEELFGCEVIPIGYDDEPTCEHKVKVPGMSGSIYLPYDICSDCGEVVRHDTV